MFKTIAATFIAIATSLSFLLSSPPSKSSYHSLFLSPSLSHNASISHHLFTLTRRPHVAGSAANAEAAFYVLSTLTSYNIKSHVASYDVSLTYPGSRSLTLTPPPPDPPTSFTLRQEVYEGDPYADESSEVLPTFHAYAKSGTAAGPVAYVNYGLIEDYRTLREMGVNVSGCVVLARYGKIYRGNIVENAYEAGAMGVVVYSDRKDYGGGGTWFPDDKWLPPSGVQVGSVFNGAGDPTTPGWPSTGACERLSDDEVEKGGDVPLIPSLPVSGADGETILKSIGGQVANDDWQGGKDAPVYRVGPGPAVVNLSYMGKQVISKIENVIGIIEGEEEPDRFVILGNHRDAWTFGAVDPNSGTAAMLEVAQRLAKLQEKGWKPRRTIIFCNWDAEEYGLIGSTEWVEENREMLASKVVAYLNVDTAVAGAGFQTSATPQLDQLIIEATQQVEDPDNSSQTIYESWVGTSKDPKIGRLGGGGSDYAAFVQHIGVPAAEVTFGGVASLWGLVALRLADEELLPFNYLSYANELQKSAEELRDEILDKGINLAPLFKSIEVLKTAATKVNNERKAMEENQGWSAIWTDQSWKVRELNDRLMMTERAFTDRDGLFGRPWYKHLIYAPSKHNDYGSKSFPGIDDAIEKAKSLNTRKSWTVVQHEVWRVSRAVTQASLVLNGKLT
ncbi:hypothetical protein LguiA_020055 [Lonicera macranthoides]